MLPDAAGSADVVEAMNEGTRSLGSDRVRSVAQLNMLHSLAATLNSLGDVEEIGAAITAELRTIIDYHNCRVYVLQPDAHTLLPVAFSGDISSEYGVETIENLSCQVGEGITGRVAATRESLLTPDAREVDFAVPIPGTADILESMLAVPMLAGNDVSGVIVLSSLGYGKFDEEDRRLLEVLASHAAVAIENAKLFQAEREAAETSTSLLRLSQALTGMHTTEAILGEAMATIPNLVACAMVSAYLRDDDTGAFQLQSLINIGPIAADASSPELVDPEVAQRFLLSLTEPFVLPRELVAQVPSEYQVPGEPREVLVAPLRWEPDRFGALVLIAPDPSSSFREQDVRLAGGIADIASLALGNASRLTELERFHELVESLDAVFWEAYAGSLTFTFLSSRASDLFGADGEAWVMERRTWGQQIVDEDRAAALETCRVAGTQGDDASIEYRVRTPDGRTAWIRDMVHAVRNAQGAVEGFRGLMVDVTERRRSEQALRKSERKYSEAFKREREASQRLRALDEMKNTFLEAVSHDLRTPLTSILGSALTLEQSGLSLPREDALDLIGRIAANARKLERLLSDLLDLDRLQRGIITPQRRSTDLNALVRRCVAETDLEAGREITVDVARVTVEVDAAKVERILENLLSNAIRHTPATTQVWVRAHEQDGGVLLIVEDAGPGISEDLREAVFEPFRQAPGSVSTHSPGVGVGLTLVRRFAELHGGRAWLEPRGGGGASFRVFLPAA
jgi:PAS domain S-box-containing protein